MKSIEERSSGRLRALLRDLSEGLHQQMFFWGRDVVHPEGNAFIRGGFEKRSCVQLPGSSVYGREWQGGRIELHGSQAGWYGEGGGFVYLRVQGRCYQWQDAEPPVPGEWSRDFLDASQPERTLELAGPFLDWWLSFEQEVVRRHGLEYRDSCFRHYNRLPRSRAWLSPAQSIRWVHGLRHEPGSLPRARRFSESD
ncbi:MAG: hypothetical protein AAGI48_03610 [Verrucomicrobiota bacterium]